MSDRYEIKSKLAEGGLGAVYLAHDSNLDREVALKRVLPEAIGDDPEAAASLVKEAKVLSSLQHPNIVTVYDVGNDDKGPYVVMEYLKGETLDKTMKRGALPQGDFEQLVTQCLEGLIAAQAVGLVHRDLKPANIMVIWHASGKFQLKILDFGLAKFSRQPSKQTIDQGNAIMGSIYFMAPEQFERGDLDGRTDLYSIGAIFYYTLTTQYPYQGDSAPEVMASHLQHTYHPLSKLRPDLPAWIGEWIDWLMSRQAKHRPASAKEALNFFRKESFRSVADRETFAAEHEQKLAAAKAARQQKQAQAQAAAASATGKLATPGQAPTTPQIAGAGQQTGKLVAGTPSGAIPVVDDTPTATPVFGAAPALGSSSAKLSTGSATGQLSGSSTGAAAAGALQQDGAAAGSKLATDATEDDAITVGEFVEEAEETKGPLSKIPKWMFITIPLIFFVGGGFALKGMLDRKASNKRVARITQMAEEEKPEGTPEDVRLLLGFLEGGEHSSEEYSLQAAVILSNLQGDGVDEAIAKGIESGVGNSRINLVKVVGMREYSDGLPYLLKELKNSNNKIHLSAWNSIGMVGKINDVPALIEALDQIDNGSKSEDNKEREFAKEAIINICDTSSREEERTRAVLAAVNQVEKDDTKKTLLQIAGRLSTPQALNRLKTLLRDKNMGINAARAIGEWQSTEPMAELLAFIKEAKGEGEKLVALQSMVAITMRPSTQSHATSIKLLAEAADYVPPKRRAEKNALIAAISQLADPTAKPAIEKLAVDELASRAPFYLEKNAEMLAKIVPVEGDTTIGCDKAQLLGEGARLSNGIATDWMGVDSWLRWDISVKKAGKYGISVEQASDSKKPGKYRVMIADSRIDTSPTNTGSKKTFKEVSIGSCNFPEAGNYAIWIQPQEIPEGTFLMELKSIKLSEK